MAVCNYVATIGLQNGWGYERRCTTQLELSHKLSRIPERRLMSATKSINVDPSLSRSFTQANSKVNALLRYGFQYRHSCTNFLNPVASTQQDFVHSTVLPKDPSSVYPTAIFSHPSWMLSLSWLSLALAKQRNPMSPDKSFAKNETCPASGQN